jgi:hypothetical protein
MYKCTNHTSDYKSRRNSYSFYLQVRLNYLYSRRLLYLLYNLLRRLL